MNHWNCADGSSAGTARQAEIKPDIPSHLFPTTLPKNSGESVERPNSCNSLTMNSKAESSRSQQEFDAFDGDDLQLDDFLGADRRRGRAKEPAKKPEFQFDEADWLSIDSTPSPTWPKPATQREKGDDWAADMGPQEDEEYEPIRLPTGNWACNHKCKDKTRYALPRYYQSSKLTSEAANTSAVVRVLKSHLDPARSELCRTRNHQASTS